MPVKRIGRVVSYRQDSNAARIHLENGPLSIGDTIHIEGPGIQRETSVEALQMPQGPTQKAEPGDDVDMPVEDPVEEGSLVFRITDPYDPDNASVLDQVFEE